MFVQYNTGIGSFEQNKLSCGLTVNHVDAYTVPSFSDRSQSFLTGSTNGTVRKKGEVKQI